MGADIDICCLWESSENQGGPIMEPKQMGPPFRLGNPSLVGVLVLLR